MEVSCTFFSLCKLIYLLIVFFNFKIGNQLNFNLHLQLLIDFKWFLAQFSKGKGTKDIIYGRIMADKLIFRNKIYVNSALIMLIVHN